MRILLNIAYVGTNYSGWQSQKNKNTIEDIIEKTYKNKLGEDIKLFASGRTDAGVHAFNQCAHFDTKLKIHPEKFATILNKVLPNDIRVIKSSLVSNDFHARFDVKKKTYVYKLYMSQEENPFKYERALHIDHFLDVDNMIKASKEFIGTHDFTSFCKAVSNQKDCTRTIYDIIIKKLNNKIHIEITGNGFLHNMVRIIVGTLIDAGSNKLSSNDIREILKNKDRTKASKTVPAYALYLKDVEYWHKKIFMILFKKLI